MMHTTATNSLRTAAARFTRPGPSRITTGLSSASPNTPTSSTHRRHLATTNPSPTSPPANASSSSSSHLDSLRKNYKPPTGSYTISGPGPVIRSVNATMADELESPTRFLRMIIFGKPGAGKGTLTARLVKKYDLVAVSTGDLLRQHIAERTDVGKEAEEIVAKGGLLPDEVMLKVVTSKLDSLHHKNWILDGFPRSIGQGKLLDAHLIKRNTPLTLVVNLDIPDNVILSRISDRWIHPASGRVYNMSYNQPRVQGFDDETGEPLVRRPDDNPEVFARRLSAFYETTSPLLNHYIAQTTKSSDAPRNSLQHPHQVSFYRPHKLKLSTLTGATSDEIWPKLDELASQFPALKPRSEVLRMRHSLSDAIVASGTASANAYRPTQSEGRQ